MTFNQVNRMLPRHKNKTVGLLPKKTSSFLCPVKDNLELKMPGVLSIPVDAVKSILNRLPHLL
jgi:hypothetical protein